ncbi:hypothetical protein H2199_000590 [Coniosporium tulheliwenetii]|uniref:Uncharacterized protein n=1 Tax=Coniosporium tulheliwenetii TaxID=3383036 RepID=A0ACC2ZMF2_9PEZI|nr:hypothetical protein H2199_000590 [Cladosporium sp. JES 115]
MIASNAGLYTPRNSASSLWTNWRSCFLKSVLRNTLYRSNSAYVYSASTYILKWGGSPASQSSHADLNYKNRCHSTLTRQNP